MKIYFSHPTFTYHTKTEKRCIRLIETKFEKLTKIINPASFGALKDSKSQIKESDIIIGLAINNKYTFLVWKEIEYGQKNNNKIYSINATNKNQITDIKKGLLDEHEKLDRDKSQKFKKNIQAKDNSIKSMLLGERNKF